MPVNLDSPTVRDVVLIGDGERWYLVMLPSAITYRVYHARWGSQGRTKGAPCLRHGDYFSIHSAALALMVSHFPRDCFLAPLADDSSLLLLLLLLEVLQWLFTQSIIGFQQSEKNSCRLTGRYRMRRSIGGVRIAPLGAGVWLTRMLQRPFTFPRQGAEHGAGVYQSVQSRQPQALVTHISATLAINARWHSGGGIMHHMVKIDAISRICASLGVMANSCVVLSGLRIVL